MKKLYFLLIVFSTISNLHSQIINFPNASFKNKLLDADYWNSIAKDLEGNSFKIDANNNGEIEQSEALQVSYLDFYGLSPAISSFEGIEYFTNLTFLNADANIATSADLSALVNLETLYFTSPFMTSLNVSGLVNLKVLKCGGGQLTALDVSDSVNLEILHCGLNQITSIDLTGLAHLIELSVANNNLTALNLSDQPDLEFLECGTNQINTLDLSNQNALNWLSCHDNPFGSLDLSMLPDLEYLLCSSNGLTALDVSNSPLLYNITCNNNQLTSLDLSGLTNLESLFCTNNQMTSLELSDLPNLTNINCSDNFLQSLDLSEATGLQAFMCNNNQLTSLNSKNGKVEVQWNFFGNPNLEYICADEEMIEGMKAHADALELNCEVNSYCSFTPGGAFYTITGTNKFDTNNNGCDAEDIVYPHLKLALSDGVLTGNMISDASGNYTYPIQAGTYTLAPVFENPNYFTVTPASASITFPAEATTINQDFCITANEIHQDIDVNIIPLSPAIPGFDAHYKIIYRNIGNVAIAMGTVGLNYNDDVLDFVSASPDTEVLPVGSLFWTFANLQPFETRTINLSFNLNSPMETPPLNGGDVLTFEASSQTSVGEDANPTDNFMILNQTVVNSFDPNDKTCLEGTSITPDMIGKYVHYMIRFENTGTFAAQNIVVKDMIDATKFDVSSLIALGGSHPYVTRITGNKVEFIFEGINLPFEDSTNDEYLVFKIKTLPTLVLGNSFSNTASIYFDYNHPIVTEPAVTTFAELATKDFEFSNYLTIYPNPTSGILNITSKQDIEMQSISIYNVLGQMVVSAPNAKGVNGVDVSSLSTGNYFIKVVSDKGTSNSKFIKQ